MEEEVQKEIVSVALIVKMVTARLEGIVNLDAKTDFMEGDDMFTYTSIVRRETTKPVDVTPVSIYMTVPLDEGISRDVTFNDGMTTDQSLDEDVVPDDLNRSPIPTITPCVNGEYLTVVHELPMPMKHKI
ncbi:hypothetical protein MAR_011207 [Mya arenaria]|uniref:Uncharacterized protein n=1 Tax=Mya arenaria TaxID=6604 RepID=A0ABY7FTE4_MYAAR|nr:hypothetical protein MAR_011207 [Mya arenaria]